MNPFITILRRYTKYRCSGGYQKKYPIRYHKNMLHKISNLVNVIRVFRHLFSACVP